MNLKFPPLLGGVASGLADAGIETFEGDYAHYVVRESIQNSLDAAADDKAPVKVCFTHKRFEASMLPFKDELLTSITRCADKWGKRPREKSFLRDAQKHLKSGQIDILEISDYGTTGVMGDDSSEDSNWFGLVKSRGNPVHADETSAGSFGIGKDAPLAASAVRTVLYSSITQKEEEAFQGVCRLATHENDEGGQTQQTGFIGKYLDDDPINPEHLAIRNRKEIPAHFRRDEPGLSIWIVGFKYGADQWQKAFKVSVITNFWPAIHSGKLVVTIGEDEMNKENLGKHLDELKADKKIKEQRPYIDAILKPTISHEEEVYPAGACSLHILTGSSELPRRICLTRKSGMVIDYYRPRGLITPYAGIFQCVGDKGNTLLRALEPPTHDKWDKNRARSSEEKIILDNIRGWIRNKLIELNPAGNSDTIDETNVNKFVRNQISKDLPQESDPKEGESIEPKDSFTNSIETRQTVKIAITETTTDGGGNDDGDAGGGEGSTTENPGPGDGVNTGGQPGTSGDQGSGDAQGSSKGSIKSIRAFSTDGGDSYKLIIRGQSDGPVDLSIYAHCDDGTSSPPIPIDKATNEDSGQEYSISNALIRGIDLGKVDTPTKITITPKYSEKYSIGVSIKS